MECESFIAIALDPISLDPNLKGLLLEALQMCLTGLSRFKESISTLVC